ncbi:MAG TPA: hypothetical protein VGM88_29305 [Kofleriaceae bacterium]|jgi:hypothetical protein
MTRLAWLALAGIALAACGGDDADVAGDYTVALTNGSNGCNLSNFTPDQSTTGISVTITQSSSDVTAVVNGLAGAALDALLADHTFTGDIDGNALSLTIAGTRSNNTGNCTYTFNADLDAKIDGDTLTGTLTYTGAGNGNSDCIEITGCKSIQQFNGTRPPQ